jgi:hypothetical protein
MQRVWTRTLLLAATMVGVPTIACAELFFDAGIHHTRVRADIAEAPEKQTSTEMGLHLAVGLRRELRQGSIGARVELDDIDGDQLLALRAFDYRRHVSDRLALSAFLGAARLDLATPAHGYYLGGGIQIKELIAGWDLGIDLRLGDKIARDNLLPTDPRGDRPDNFYDLSGVSVYLSRRF